MSYINAEEERKANKFRNMLGKKMPSSRHYSDYKTDREYSTEILQNPVEYQKALTLRNSFENSAAKVIRSRLGSQKVNAPILKSLHKASFQDPSATKIELNKFSVEDFQPAFNGVAVHGVIEIRDIVGIVRSVMGGDLPLWVLNKFVSLGQQVAKFKVINWAQFRVIVLKVRENSNYECNQCGPNIPSWIKGSPANASGLVAYKHDSSYMADFNEERLVSYDNMNLDASKTGTTKDLFHGTTKDTYQLSGYGGHIPLNTNNAKKELHSKGATVRPQPCYLRLVSERLGSVPSYSGYIPISTGLSGERTTGMDPMTTTGSAYGVNF